MKICYFKFAKIFFCNSFIFSKNFKMSSLDSEKTIESSIYENQLLEKDDGKSRHFKYDGENSDNKCTCDKPNYCKCNLKEGSIDRSIDLLFFAIVVTLFFILLSLPSIDRAFSKAIPFQGHRLVAKSLIFFVLVYLVHFILLKWRSSKNYCYYR